MHFVMNDTFMLVQMPFHLIKLHIDPFQTECNCSLYNIFPRSMLPLVLVRSQIKNMLGRETGKNMWERISLLYNSLVHCERVNFKVTGINFMTVFIMRREAASF